jgi:hypothetical protein
MSGGALGGAASDGCGMKAEPSAQHAGARCEHAQGAAGGMVVTGLQDESTMVGYTPPQVGIAAAWLAGPLMRCSTMPA